MNLIHSRYLVGICVCVLFIYSQNIQANSHVEKKFTQTNTHTDNILTHLFIVLLNPCVCFFSFRLFAQIFLHSIKSNHETKIVPNKQMEIRDWIFLTAMKKARDEKQKFVTHDTYIWTCCLYRCVKKTKTKQNTFLLSQKHIYQTNELV